MTNYGLPYFLEDKSGSLKGSDFVDINDRMQLKYHCTARDSNYAAYMITDPHYDRAVMALDFGPNNALGNVSYGHASKAMKDWLSPVRGSKTTRKFRASDGQEYVWSWRTQPNQEWTCTNLNGTFIASYSLKAPGEPPYEGSSGCSLTVSEAFGHLAAEMLASLMIMRHIVHYRL